MSRIGEIIQGNFLLGNTLPSRNQPLPEGSTPQRDAPNQLVQRRSIHQNLRPVKNNNKPEQANTETSDNFKGEKISILPPSTPSAENNQNQLIAEYQKLSIEIKKVKIVAPQHENNSVILSKIEDTAGYEDGNANDIAISSHPYSTIYSGNSGEGFMQRPIPAPYMTAKPEQESGQNIDIWV
ncbi:MAG: hypothetical protein HZB79_05740 [Deltaproteobacteria bacterium]|nr:hypothetical protein [Deltaproteobacteria bacterium]